LSSSIQPDQNLLSELVRRITQVTRPVRVVLFGSAGRGEMLPNSDLDVLVIVSDNIIPRDAVRAIYRNLIGFSASVDVIVATESDLQLYGDNVSLVYYPAIHEGREIYAA